VLEELEEDFRASSFRTSVLQCCERAEGERVKEWQIIGN